MSGIQRYGPTSNGPYRKRKAGKYVLFADHQEALADIEKRVEGFKMTPPNVGYGDGWQDYNSAIDDALNAIKSSSSSSTEEREV